MKVYEARVIDMFIKAFKDDANLRICLYGTGKYTKLLIENARQYNIIGVADFANEAKVFSGHRMLSVDEINQECDCVVLVTNNKNIRSVYQKLHRVAQAWRR